MKKKAKGSFAKMNLAQISAGTGARPSIPQPNGYHHDRPTAKPVKLIEF
jgi:hypothetical protein